MGNLSSGDNGRDVALVEARLWLAQMDREGGDEDQERHIATISQGVEELLGFRRRIGPEHSLAPRSVDEAEDWILRVAAELAQAREAFGNGPEVERPDLDEGEQDRWVGRLRRRISHLEIRLRYLNCKLLQLRKEEARRDREAEEHQTALMVLGASDPRALLVGMKRIVGQLMCYISETQEGGQLPPGLLGDDEKGFLLRVTKYVGQYQRVQRTRPAAEAKARRR